MGFFRWGPPKAALPKQQGFFRWGNKQVLSKADVKKLKKEYARKQELGNRAYRTERHENRRGLGSVMWGAYGSGGKKPPGGEDNKGGKRRA